MKKLFGKILALIICSALLTAALLPLPASAYVKATYDDVKNSTTENPDGTMKISSRAWR